MFAHRALAAALTIAGLLSGCRRTDEVQVQPLPPLTRPTAEARVGVPEIAGTWRFAGWEVASPTVVTELGEPRRPADLVLQTQRIDSVAGYLAREDAPIRLVGEVRRDGVVALVTAGNEEAGRFAAGRVVGDTLWIELSTLPAGELSPPTLRWAYVRSPVGQAWLRLPSGALLRDTVVASPPATDTLPRSPTPSPAPPPTTQPPATPRPAPPAAAPPRAPEAPATRETPPPPAQEPPPAREPPTEDPAPPEAQPPPAQTVEPRERRDTTRWLPPPGPEVDIPPVLR